MTDVDTDGALDTARTEQGGGMRLARSRGLVSGVLLVLAGAWAALAPFVGPAFDFAYTPEPGQTWHWTAARGWYEVLPGGLAVFGGLLLVFSANRIVTIFGAWLAALGGGWLVVGQQVSYLLTLGRLGMPAAAGDRRYVAEYLAFFTGIGALIILLAAIAIGRLSVRSVRDARAAAARRDEQAAVAEDTADHERVGADREITDREITDREITDRNAETWTADGDRAGGYGPPAAASAVTTELPATDRPADDRHAVYREPYPAGPEDDTAAMPVVPDPPDDPVAPGQQGDREPPFVLEPPAGYAPDQQPTDQQPTNQQPVQLPAVEQPPVDQQPAQAPPQSGAAVWNPEAQSPTTTGELPAVGSAAPADAPVAAPARRFQAPRRYFSANNPAPQDESAPGPAADRDPVRTDEADVVDDMDLDERPR